VSKQHTRAGSRRPIRPDEIAHLEALGGRLRDARCRRGLTQATLAEAAELSESAIQRIEAGTRRTRRTTLARISLAIGDPALSEELAALAGAALAPESPYPDRIA
jgi:transcriptional regulator with XRE-family HTH domain